MSNLLTPAGDMADKAREMVALREKATQGEWQAELFRMLLRFARKNSGPWEDDDDLFTGPIWDEDENAAFIAHAANHAATIATAYLAEAAEAERLRGEVAELRAALAGGVQE